MGDNIELLEDLDKYNLRSKHGDGKLFFNYELTNVTFKDPDVALHVKSSLLDCIQHHQTIMQLCKDFDNEMNLFILAKIGDINLLLTVILFAVVRQKFQLPIL